VLFFFEAILNYVLCSLGSFYVCVCNSLVMALVSIPVYVAHFCFCVVLGVLLWFLCFDVFV
jgi:hypothetical protein